MQIFKVGAVVQLPQKTWLGVTGIVVSYDKKRERYLVSVGANQQIYFNADEIHLFEK
ncbi:hypothetical protein [Lentilactobacillus sp. SPB1-3]|uniref:Uncharacterized protein n=1 Tax=Lentilactobacillus terminaliae TaxID=3003483 RepID=A0ACD5DE02_9LACO|nr:hypothetical protein [Lentilactobacillus sp. SPB1-3]MCZ0977677.1 hypothetical protein [Lentilactobacillus sp. SPB1-3]